MKRLLILGNGFDLQAGLKTTYNDFFVSSEKPLLEKWIKDSNSVEGNQISLISLLLYNSYYRKPDKFTDIMTLYPYQVNYQSEYVEALGLDNNVENWMDIEGFLARIIKGKGFAILEKLFKKNFSFRDSSNEGICKNDDVQFLIRNAMVHKKYFYEPTFQQFVINEIKIFETRFADYIKRQLDENKNYVKNARKILTAIIPSTADDISIINFNYTQIEKRMFESFGNKKIFNVHGTIENNPIIGIDPGDTLEEKTIQFTKTFRKLVGQKVSRALEKYDEIIIYGHSLGEQDYSYFHSIFDFVDLYHGNTNVIFYYSDNYIKDNDEAELNNKRNNHRIAMAKSLFALIKKYGETLDNKGNGKNLVHKLLLEGRLQIELKNFVNSEDLNVGQEGDN